MNILLACVYVNNVHAGCPWSSEEGIRSTGTGRKEDYQLLCGCLELNLVLLQKQQVFLIAEPSPHYHESNILNELFSYFIVISDKNKTSKPKR